MIAYKFGYITHTLYLTRSEQIMIKLYFREKFNHNLSYRVIYPSPLL